MTQEALNIAGQCRATASSPLAKNILVDEGNGLLTELLLDAARIIEALAQPEQIPPSADSNTHQPKRHELQAKGEHPAPCARHCEANAFQIVIKNLKAQLAQLEQEEKLPPVEIGVDVTDIGTTVVAFYRRPNAVMEMFYSQFHPLAQPEQEPVAIKRMKEWIEYLKRKSDFGQHMKIPSEMSAGTCWELAIELEQFINTAPPQRKPLPPQSPCEMTQAEGKMFKLGWLECEAAHGIKENT